MLWQPIPPGIALVTSRAVAGLDWHVRASCQPRWAVGARSTSSWSGVLCHSQFICQNSRPPLTPHPTHPLPPLPPPPLTSSSSSSTYYCNVCLIRVVAPLPLVSSLFILLFFFVLFLMKPVCSAWSGLSCQCAPRFFPSAGETWRTVQQSLQCCLFVCLCVALVKAIC